MRALRGEVVSDEEFVIVRTDGRLIPVLGSAAPVYGPSGKIEGAVVSYQDITPLKDLERLREEFMSAAAHELRSPVTVIKGQSQLALLRDATEEPARRAFKSIVQQTDRVSQIIDDLLTVVRVRPGRVALKVTRFDLSPLVQSTVAKVGPNHPSLRFDTAIDGPLVVDGDRALVVISINRLLDNAIRYSPPGCSTEVKLRPRDNQAVLSVTDHGIGIAVERQAHAFEPFFELVPPGEPGYLGVVSLDLYLAKHIVDANGGRMWFTSTPHQGSTFSFSLPLARNGGVPP